MKKKRRLAKWSKGSTMGSTRPERMQRNLATGSATLLVRLERKWRNLAKVSTTLLARPGKIGRAHV